MSFNLSLINKNRINPRTLLSNLWILVLFNIVFRDLHQLGSPGFLEQMMSGVVNGVEITEQLMLIGGFLAEVPILMVLLSRILADRANKWANIIAGVIQLGVFATSAPYADMDDVFHMFFQVAAIVWVFRIAWKLPSRNKYQAQA